MRERLLITTAIGLMLGAGAYAQSPSEQPRNSSPPGARSQNNPNSSSAPSASSSTPSSQSSTPSAQNTQSAPSATSRPQTTTSQSAPVTGNNDSSRSQAQSNQASPPSQARQDNDAATAPSQTQSAQQPGLSSQAQTNTAPPANNRTQASPSDTNANTNAGTQPSTNTAAQPSNNQTNTAAQSSNSTAQSRSSNVNISANLDDRQRTRVTESITKLNARPLENVNFSLSVGTVVPRDVYFQPLPADVVEIVPQYRGYNFFVVRNDIVIVDPATYKIVDVLPRTGRSTAAAPASRKTTFSDTDTEVIRKHARSSRTEQRTTGSSTTSTRVRVGDGLPDSAEIRSFPEEIYRESPTLQEYRYIERDNRTYVIEPHERTIIEEID
jgi:hypothetical protein